MIFPLMISINPYNNWILINEKEKINIISGKSLISSLIICNFVCGKTTILYAFDIKHATRYPMEEAKLKMHYWEWFNKQADWDDDGAGNRSYKVIPVNK